MKWQYIQVFTQVSIFKSDGIETYKGMIANLPGYGKLHQQLLASSHFRAASGSIHKVFPESTKENGVLVTRGGGGRVVVWINICLPTITAFP